MSHLMLQTYRPGDSEPFDRVKAGHLLNRAGFGGTEEEIGRVMEVGPVKAVERLLEFPDLPAEEQTPEDGPDLSAITEKIDDQPFPHTFREIQKLLAGKSEAERKEIRQKLMRGNVQALTATGSWWLKRMASGAHPLQEKLTLFWHGHFTTSAKEERSAWLMWRQNELLRRQAAGNFGKFVHEISRDPAMLDYLNNQQNRKQHPNENYARELMELFTLGIGHYSETDVKEAARAFTGWGHNSEEFVFLRFNHDDGEKVFLGERGRLGGDEVIEIILAQTQCARYIAGKLFEFFAYEDPEPRIVEDLGDLLRKNHYELRPLLKAILTSRAFYSERAIGSQIKSPVQLVMGTIRLLKLSMPPGPLMMRQLGLMGQMPLNPPNVKGWPGGRQWISTSTLFARYNTVVGLAGGDAPGWRLKAGERPRFVVEEKRTPEALVDEWVKRLIQRPIGEDKRRILIEALDGRADREDSARKMVQLIVSMPEYQLC